MEMWNGNVEWKCGMVYENDIRQLHLRLAGQLLFDKRNTNRVKNLFSTLKNSKALLSS